MSNIQKQHKISPAIAWLTIQKFIIFYCPLDREHTISGWGFISTVPLRKPRFYAVSGTCFCRYLSEYSNNDLFSCMLTIWTYLIVTITTWIFFSITLFLHFVIRYFYIFPITNSLMLQFMDKPDLDKFHACIEIWQISRTKWMPVHEQNKVARKLVCG